MCLDANKLRDGRGSPWCNALARQPGDLWFESWLGQLIFFQQLEIANTKKDTAYMHHAR